MKNGKQGEQLLKVLGGHSASLDRTSKMQRAKWTAKLYSGGHKAIKLISTTLSNVDDGETVPTPVNRYPNTGVRCFRYKIFAVILMFAMK